MKKAIYCRLRTVRGEKVLRNLRDCGQLYYISALSGKRVRVGSAGNGKMKKMLIQGRLFLRV
ncbi:hypothetical protein JOE25_000881 [Serratia sp. PL17]|nr:hypothetical protein [Serratia sp. PL17]